ncbi:retrovirus-related pol polyprotein from transposon TNT 1-94 [Tanacetum coccineum]
MQVNVQFLQQLQPEWSRFVTVVKQRQEIDTVSYHKLFDVLKQFQNEVNDIRSERLARSANPLALIAAAQPYSDNYYQAPKPQRSNAPSYKQSSSTRPKQAQRDKDMQKNLALLAKYFKKLYKPTNNNLRTSSNSRNKTEDTTPRYNNDNQSGQFGNQRTMKVAGARETVGSPVVQQNGIQCFNCKGFGHYARELTSRFGLDDTDEEIDEQELEAHYSYMAKDLQEVPLRRHSSSTRYAIGTEESKTILKQLKKANASLTQELKKCKTNLDESSRALGEATSSRDSSLIALQTKQTELEKYTALNDLTSDYKILQTKLNETLGLLALKDIDIKEGLKTKTYEISVVNQKHDELVKKSLLTRSQFEGQLKEKSKSIQTIHMLAPKCATYHGRSTFANPKYLKKAQSDKPRLYEIPYDTSDPANRFCPDGEETVTLEKESRSKLDKDTVKPYNYTYQNSLYETFKPPSKAYLDQLERAKEVRKTMWRKTFRNDVDFGYVNSLEKELDELESEKADFSNIYDLLLEECVSKDVTCSYLHSMSHLNANTELQCMYLHKVKECECLALKLSKRTESVNKESLPQNRNRAVRNTNGLKPGMYRIASTTIQTNTPQLPHASRNTNPHMSKSSGVIHTTSVSRPQLKSYQVKEKVVPNISQVKFTKKEVEDHHRISSISKKTKSVTACNDSSNSRTSNVNAVCAECGKCVFNSNHDACVSRYLKDVNARTKKPHVVPISASKPKRKANKSVATPHKKTVASDTTIQKSKSYYKKLYEDTNQEWKWWIAKRCPSGYTWTQKPLRTKKIWMPKIRKDDVSSNISPTIDIIVQLILFIVDSGCTKHMTGNLKLLCNFVEKFLGTVRFGNDQFAPILGYGDLIQGNVTIKRVYYVEGLNHNLFSVGQFCDADLEVAFRKSTCFVRDLQGNDLLTGSRGSDLYTISLQETTSSTPICFMAKASPTQAWLWHRRLSHLNFDYITLLSKKDIVTGLPKLTYVKDQLCSSCEMGKAKRSSFKSKAVPSSKGRLNLLHMDLCGPMRVASINGKKYILVIVDDYSRYTWTLFLRSKDETPEVLKDFLTMIQRNLQAQVITVRTDRGTT